MLACQYFAHLSNPQGDCCSKHVQPELKRQSQPGILLSCALIVVWTAFFLFDQCNKQSIQHIGSCIRHQPLQKEGGDPLHLKKWNEV